ncbi:hypothetical protein ACUXV3_16240 [Roseobacteraceae bacterium NS-SX3]
MALGSTPAEALSCLPWGPADAYLQAAQSESVYYVLAGELRFDPDLLPKPAGDNPNEMPELTRVPAQLTGKMLGTQSFSQPVSVDVTLEIPCIGPWCGRAEPGADYILFAEQRGESLVVTADPCAPLLFPDIRRVRESVIECHRGGNCAASALR